MILTLDWHLVSMHTKCVAVIIRRNPFAFISIEFIYESQLQSADF